ncbi:MAG: hypothetical protein HYZ47_05375 [Simkania negevensis]|nr:hypothetical protein [Simkania negevensis]
MSSPPVSPTHGSRSLNGSLGSFVHVHLRQNDLGDPAFPSSSSPTNKNLSTLETASPLSLSLPSSSPPSSPPLSPVLAPSLPPISQEPIELIPPLSPFWRFISFINLPRHFIHFCRLIWTGEFRYSFRNLWNKLFNSIYQTKLINLLNQHFEFWKRQLSKQPNFPVEIQIRLHCGAGFYKVKIAAIRNKKSWDQVLSKDLPNIQRRIELHIGKTNIRDANLEASFFLIFSSENKLRKMSGKEIIALSPAQQVLLEIEQQEQQSCYNTSSTFPSLEKAVICQYLTTINQPEGLYSREK